MDQYDMEGKRRTSISTFETDTLSFSVFMAAGDGVPCRGGVHVYWGVQGRRVCLTAVNIPTAEELQH